MEKIGEGGQLPQPSEEAYRKSLQNNITRLQNALASYSSVANEEEKSHLEDIMKQQMDLIKTNVQEIKRAGIQKQGETVSSDYEKFKSNPTSDNLTAFQQDISTLKEYSLLSE